MHSENWVKIRTMILSLHWILTRTKLGEIFLSLVYYNIEMLFLIIYTQRRQQVQNFEGGLARFTNKIDVENYV